MADAPSWQPLPPRRRKRQKSDTTTDTVSAFEQKAKANAEALRRTWRSEQRRMQEAGRRWRRPRRRSCTAITNI